MEQRPSENLQPPRGPCCKPPAVMLAFLLLPLLTVSARGAEPDEIVVTASRVPVPLRQVAASISVLTAEEIEAHGNLPLVDVLRQLPSVSATGNGGVGKITTLNIRGEEGFRTLAIFDGIRLGDPSGVQVAPQLEHLLSSGVARVEVLRGPQGLGYGADAGGIVNLSSRRAGEDVSANLSAQAGAFGTRQFSGDLAGRRGSLDYYLGLADFETAGFNARPSDTRLRDKDGYANTTAHGRLGWRFSEEWRADVVHRSVEGDTAFDGCFAGSIVHDCASDYRLRASRFALEYASGRFSHSLSYADTRTERAIFSLGASAFDARGELMRLEYLGSATALPGFDLVFGADREDMRTDGAGRRNRGLHVEVLSDFSERLFLTAGARHDRNDDFGSHTTYRLGGAWLSEAGADARLKFRASLGTGFRAPSPYEIAYNDGPFASPPASLTPLREEHSRGYEVGVEYSRGESLRWGATWFDQEVADAIEFDLAAFSGYRQEAGSAASRGIELSASVLLGGGLGARMNYTWNETRRPNGLPRSRRPEHRANAGLEWEGFGQRLRLNAFLRLARDSIDESAAGPVELDGFEVLDLSAQYRLPSGWEIHARLENALDEEYREIIDYATAGRALYVGLRLRLGQ